MANMKVAVTRVLAVSCGCVARLLQPAVAVRGCLALRSAPAMPCSAHSACGHERAVQLHDCTARLPLAVPPEKSYPRSLMNPPLGVWNTYTTPLRPFSVYHGTPDVRSAKGERRCDW